MRRFIAALCIIAAVFTLCACAPTAEVDTTEDNMGEEKIIVENEYFTVKKLLGKDDITRYNYIVTDMDGNVLEDALCAEEPRIAQINDSLVGIRFTADGHSFSRYYDIEKGLVSQSFKNAFWDNGTLVATNDYDNGHYFVIQDIFYEDGFYSRTEIESSSWQISVISVEICKEGNALKVSYVHGDGSDKQAQINTVELPLTEAGKPADTN